MIEEEKSGSTTPQDNTSPLVKSLATEASAPRTAPNFIAKLHRQRVTVRQPGQPALNGVLAGFSVYEILITDDRGRDHLIFKGAGVVIDCPDGWRRRPGAEAEEHAA